MTAVFWALIAGLFFWLVLWAAGFGGFDAFLVLMFFLVGAIAYRAVRPMVDKALGRSA